MRFIQAKTRGDDFHSRFFDFQKSHKYVVELEHGVDVETTGYEHYLAGHPVDLAIDISSMAGCPMACTFCAGTSRRVVRALSDTEITAQARFVLNELGAEKFPQVTCSYQGIGEPTLAPESVIGSSLAISQLDRRIVLSLSTIGADRPGLKKILASGVTYDNVQVTMCGTSDEMIRQVMPRAPRLKEAVQLVMEIADSASVRKAKINYVLLKGLNDTDDSLDCLIRTFRGSRVIVKISAMNTTIASRRNNLVSGELVRAREFVARLTENGVDSFVFGAFSGIDLSCGQLSELEGK